MIRILAAAVSVALLVFTARRYLFLLGSFLPRRRQEPVSTRSIAVLIAARNEAALLPRLLAALEQLDYPAHLLHFILVSDGSTDNTPRLLEAWTADRPNAIAHHCTQSAGKAGALTLALSLAPEADLIAVLDADTVPSRDVLQTLAAAFEDPSTGAAGGFPEPGNASASQSAGYAAIERWILHLVTLAGKDRLRMNPAAIGAVCMIRPRALREIGGFPAGATAEDIHISIALNRRGWRTRAIAEAVVREDVPETFGDFRAQRLRWGRGLLETRRNASGLEDFLVAAGYLDRVVLFAGVILAFCGEVPLWLLVLYAAAPFITIMAAISRARADRKWLTLLVLPKMLLADVAVTLLSLVRTLRPGPIAWAGREPEKPRQGY